MTAATWPVTRRAAAAGGIAAVLACAACSSGEPASKEATASPTSSAATASPSASAPATASSTGPSESVRAQPALDAVQEYYRTTDQLFTDPAVSIDRASTVAGGSELEQVRRLVQQQRLGGERQTGSVVVRDLVATDEEVGPSASVDVDACLDVSGVDVVDAAGQSVVTGDRADRSLVHLRVVDRGVAGWLVESTDARGEVCAGT